MIRRVRVEDVDIYRAVRLRALRDSPSAFGSTYEAEAARPHDAWAERVAGAAHGHGRATFLAFADDQCMGLAGGGEDDYGADRQLVSMWVAPPYRGTGIARDLVEEVLAWAKEGRGRQIALWVTRGNDRAQHFYERMGFVATGEVQPLPSDPCKDEIRMTRLL